MPNNNLKLSLFLLLGLSSVTSVLSQNGNFAGSVPTVANNNPTSSSSYNCPSTCKPPSCICASKGIPGGLNKDDIPQFVTLTFDDAIQPYSFDAWRKWLNSSTNANGCPIPATFFVSTAWSDFALIQKTFNEGHEIGCHTINHPNLVNVSASVASNEMRACVEAISLFGGVPKNTLQGFRHPFLSFNKATYDTVFNTGFNYETSVVLDPRTQDWWPHTLDYGMPYDPQPCTDCPSGPSFVYPGKWIIPMYSKLNTDNQIWTSMDPIIIPSQPATYDQALENLKASFKLHYEKKLPFGLYQHAAQLVAWSVTDTIDRDKKIQLLTDFVDWTMKSYKDTWYVTNQQLIDWMKNPVPTKQMLSRFPCAPPAVDSSNQEICDGVDNNKDGTVDSGLQQLCQYSIASFYSCFGCPSAIPNISTPITQATGADRKRVPDAGCSGFRTWDPVGGSCVALKRQCSSTQTYNASAGVCDNLPGTLPGEKAAATTSFTARLGISVAIFSALATYLLFI